MVVTRAEEGMKDRPPEVEVRQHDAPTRSRKCNRNVRNAGGLSLARERGGHHDRSGAPFEVDELEARPQPAIGLRMDASGLCKHHELIRLPQGTGGTRHAPEEGHTEHLLDLLFGANSPVERFEEECE